MKIKELKNKSIAILGFGKEGKSTLEFLQSHNIQNITVLDKDIKSEVSGVQFILGEDYLNDLQKYDIIIKTPGISPFDQKILPYKDKIISQSHIFFSEYTGKVIGITGTKGKSTISSLLYSVLIASNYKVKLVGNIGSPVLSEIDIFNDSYDYVIYELSSYMLQDFCPKLHVGYLNNIYPCHLDWHYDSMSIYKEAKLNILQNAHIKVVNVDLKHDVQTLKGNKVFFGDESKYYFSDTSFYIYDIPVYSGELNLLGDHNKNNICGVIAILNSIMDSMSNVQKALEKILPVFGGLPNRIENIGIYENITFINDAIATTPQSTIAAIKTFSEQLQTLFVGGEDSGFDFIELRNEILASNIINIVAFPDTTELIFPEIASRNYDVPFEIEIDNKTLQFLKTRSMADGVNFAFRVTLPGKIAMLSSAAPSFSVWKNYLEKAEQFINEVKKY